MKYGNIGIKDLFEFDLKINFKELSIVKKEDIKIEEKKIEKKEVYKTSTSFEAYKNYEIEKYKKASKTIEFKQFMYVQNILFSNTQKNEAYKLEHDILQKSKDTYLYFFYTQKLLEEKYSNSNDYMAIFLTLTCPSRFHKYSSITQKANPNFDKDTTINEAYQLLNSSFREIYKDFKVNRKFEKIEYSKVIEPHKNLTPHLHAILYVKKDFVKNLVHHIQNIIKKNEIVEHKIKVIKDTSRSCAYLLKYIQKTTNPQDEDTFHFFNGWKKVNKIRVFTSSASILNRAIYKKINSVTKLSKNLKDKNAIENVLENCYIKTKQTNIEINENDEYIEVSQKKKAKGNKNGRYLVNIKKEKIKREVFVGNHFFNVLSLEKKGFNKKSVLVAEKTNFETFICEYQNFLNIKFDKKTLKNISEKLEICKQESLNIFETIFKNLTYTKTSYKITSFKIFDKIEKNMMYDKKFTYVEKDFEINPKNWKYEYVKEEYYELLYSNEFFALDMI